MSLISSVDTVSRKRLLYGSAAFVIVFHRKVLGCQDKCTDYRSEKGTLGVLGSVQVVFNADTGFGYIDVDKYNAHDVPVGTFNHIVFEILLKGGIADRPEIINQAVRARTSYYGPGR